MTPSEAAAKAREIADETNGYGADNPRNKNLIEEITAALLEAVEFAKAQSQQDRAMIEDLLAQLAKLEASQRPVSDPIDEACGDMFPPFPEAKPAVTEDILETEAMRSVVAVARMIQNQKPDTRMHHQLKRLDEIRSRKLTGGGGT